MARFNLAAWIPLPENETQRALNPTQFIVHTAVDHPGPTNLFGFFKRTDVTVESHWWLRMDGTLEQFIDTNVEAHANLKGNRFALSVETEDEGSPATTPWSPEQVDTLVELLVFVNREHGIPLQIMTDWASPGVGWHSMWGFVDGVNLTGGYLVSPWTNSRGKTCPGKLRIQQFINDVLPRAQALIGSGEENMDLGDWYQVIEHATGSSYSPAVELWQRLLRLHGADIKLDGYVGPKTKAAHERYTQANSGRVTSLPTAGQWGSLLGSIHRERIPAVGNSAQTQLTVLQTALDQAEVARVSAVLAFEEELAIGDQLALDVAKLEQALAESKTRSTNRFTMLATARAKLKAVREAVK
jgi:hypothetical protein